jgi:hypothetical protein
MRLLNSICKVIASSYAGIPVHIEEVPNNFQRGSFYVHLATDSSNIKSYNVYQDEPIFQIVYFGRKNEANQVIAEELYKIKEELKALFLFKLAIPVIPLEGVVEKPRYAKILTYTDDLRIDEGALYVKLSLSFTEDIPHDNSYEVIEQVEIEL